MEELLVALGAVSVTMQDNEDNPILEPGVGETPLWPTIKLTALFDAEHETENLRTQIYSAYNEAGLNEASIDETAFCSRIALSTLEDRDWEREWLDNYKPIRCGKRLWICPSWCDPVETSAINLMLDPGLAFGTGTHETTLLCLQWLDTQDPKGKRVLDFGCGSGILGIAALLLGADHVEFVDNDPQALQATAANLEKNDIPPSRYHICLDSNFNAKEKESTFDIVLANILAEPLIQLSNLLGNSLKPEGLITLSGLQVNQDDAVRKAYTSQISFFDINENNGWLRLTGQRTHS